ncbi:hypothetical protein HY478_03465, partial [Candidatus Uhrbacteria bacterium]|nr:hypothetical protein [Candidatus Uhrbacteria bacterium]
MDQDLKRMVDCLERLNPQRYSRVRTELLSSAEPERRELARWVCIEYAKHFTTDDYRTLGPPVKGAVDGAFPVGTIIAGRKTYGEFGLTPSDWIQHAA